MVVAAVPASDANGLMGEGLLLVLVNRGFLMHWTVAGMLGVVG